MISNVAVPLFIQRNPFLAKACSFADQKHTEARQVRKYTDEPYIVHPIEVATIVNVEGSTFFGKDCLEQMCAAALLHDTVEDTETTYNEIETEFGYRVRDMVFWLTDVTDKSQGNRRVRKELETLRLTAASNGAKFIKLADFISNTQSIVEHDLSFAAQYLSEKMMVIEAFTNQNRDYNVSCISHMIDKARMSLIESMDKISKP